MNPLDYARSKQPLTWQLNKAFYHVDQVLCYTTLKLGNPPKIEAMCLEIFELIEALRQELRRVVPKDDMDE